SRRPPSWAGGAPPPARAPPPPPRGGGGGGPPPPPPPGFSPPHDSARQELDPTRRAEFYRQAQRAYVADPGLVYLAFIDHSYVMREGEWSGYQPPVEPHTHGTTWGPWWNIESWKPQP
ncbi:hypothetical protein MOQ72_23910, partial [Saccharopolyspora sp. K220]|nr:hypothetical protein [Saccharopolyspora soli]